MASEQAMAVSVFWRTLYAPGHDAALLVRGGTGWLLSGTAVFHDERGPVSAAYRVEIDASWRARRGMIDGFAGTVPFSHRIERGSDGWVLDDQLVGLGRLVDLDYGFTPATNLQQLRRADLAVGETAEFSVAWFDIGKATLTELPQRYERRDETHYWYQSPQNGYEATLEIADSGFVRRYPDLWQMES